MGYFSVPPERWMKFLGIDEGAVPDKLIVEGRLDCASAVKSRGKALKDVRPSWSPNLVLGNHGGALVAYGTSFGGPGASQLAHIYCKIGTRRVVHIGTCGGLQGHIDLGDIVVSDGVLSKDGSARLYGAERELVPFDAALRDRAVQEVGRLGVRCHAGRTVSYYDILLEEGADLEDLSGSGYLALDMEAAVVAAVTRHFGVPSVSIMAVADNSISGRDLFHVQTEEERSRIARALDAVFEVALAL